MSRITNDNPPRRGELLTSTDLNQVFTEVNDAFPMDGDNVRNEGIDMPVFDLNNVSGINDIVLLDADDDKDTSSTVVQANTAASTPFDAPTAVHTWSKLIIFNTNKILRVYWQFENEVVGAVDPPVTSNVNATAWAIWLEWQLSSGGAWAPVPNQSDFDDHLTNASLYNYGASSTDTYATTFVNHVYVHRSGGTTEYDFPPDRTGYGCWWYQADRDYTIYGLRLMCKGLVQNFYNASPITSPATNAWEIQPATAATHQITIDTSNIAFLLMESV